MALDPLSALSAAGTVVQFIDFATKLSTRAEALSLSRRTRPGPQNTLALTIADLEALLARLDEFSIPDRPHQESDEALIRLCEECRNVSTELLTMLRSLEKIGTSNRKWNSTRQAIRAAWKKKELEQLEVKLSRLRQDLSIMLLARV
jgi:hypothetical protein